MQGGQLNEDFQDLLLALQDAAADFVVVGAHALAVHGVTHPRARSLPRLPQFAPGTSPD